MAEFKIWMVYKLFGVILASYPTPYTMQECLDSLYVVRHPIELQAESTCIVSATRPIEGTLTEDQQWEVDKYYLEILGDLN